MGTLSQLCGVDLRLLTGLHFRTNEVLLASKRGQGPHGSISSKFGHQMAPLALVTLVSLTQCRDGHPTQRSDPRFTWVRLKAETTSNQNLY